MMATDKATRRRRGLRLGVRVGKNPALVVKLPRSATLRVSTAMFERLCAANDDLRLERTATGGLVVMAPAGAESSGQNANLIGQLFVWCRQDGTGKVFDSSAGFTLPNGAVVGPDVAWVRLDRWQAVSAENRRQFAAIVPDFVAELRSPSDSLKELRLKMRQYIEQGVRLGWLLDPISGQVEIYRPGRAVEVRDRPAMVAGEDVLAGFVLDLRGILFDGPDAGPGNVG